MNPPFEERLTEYLLHARAGDKTALESLITELRVVVRDLTLSVLKQSGAKLDPKDVAQDVLIKIWQRFDSFKGETTSELFAWICTLARHAILDSYHTRNVAKSDALSSYCIMPSLPTSEGSDAEQQMMRAERALSLHLAAQRLSKRQRAIVEMRMDGLTLPEVAERLGMTTRDVQRTFAGAIRRLRNIMEEIAHDRARPPSSGSPGPPLPLAAEQTPSSPLSATSVEQEAEESVRRLYDRLGLISSDASSPCNINWGEFEQLLFGSGEVHHAPGQTPTNVPSSGQSSHGEALLEEGTQINSGIGQRPAQQATDSPTLDYVPTGDEAPPNLPRRYEILKPPIVERWPKKGAMGVVWRVRDLQFKRPVAVKVMKTERADSRLVRLFLREARITAQLTHPSIVPVHAMGWLADGRPYYTMKLVEGKTLAEILRAEPDVASQRMELLQVFARVCEAVAFAHRQGVLHLDLKPSNVMVGAHREVQVMDWGLAKLLDESDDQLGIWETLALAYGKGAVHLDLAPSNAMVGAHREVQVMDWGLAKLLHKGDDQTGVIGTLPYISREQANGRIDQLDRRTDVFGLGAMLCEILTRKPPYDGTTKADVLRQAREADLARAHAELEKCGADAQLIALARACLSAEPEDRPEDASVVEKRLMDYLASVEERLRQAERDRAAAEARAKEAVLTRQQAEKARRRTLWLVAIAGLCLVVLLVAGFFAWRVHTARETHLADTIDKALTAAMSGDLGTADQAVAEAEGAGASPGQVEMLRGQIALHRGQSREARQHLEEAVRQLPNSVAARGMLAAAYAWDGRWERYDKVVREMEQLTPSTPEDFLFKGYAEANLEPERGLRTIKQAFDRRPMMGIALLLRAEVRALVAQDTDNLEEAEGAVQDAKYARELLRDNPAALWVSLGVHLAKAGVHEHRGEPKQREAELELAGKDADALKPFTALPEAVVYRWVYFRELGREEEVLEELREASKNTEHVYVTSCCALALYRRGKPSDLEEALSVLTRRPGTYNDRLLPFVLAEHDYGKRGDWPASALKAYEDFAATAQDLAALMDTQSVLCLLRKKGDAVKASKALQKQKDLFYTLRREPILRCLDYKAGDLTADELLRGAEGSRWNQCLAHYYIAITKLAEGDRNGAREHFDKVVETRAFLWGAYDMSWVFQARLTNDRTWPPWISKVPAK